MGMSKGSKGLLGVGLVVSLMVLAVFALKTSLDIEQDCFKEHKAFSFIKECALKQPIERCKSNAYQLFCQKRGEK